MDWIEHLYQVFQKHPKVITDSRKIEEGCLFFALKGEHFNGNKYAKEALEKGAAYAVIDEVVYKKSEQYVLVDDVLLALQKLANFHRKKMIIPLIAITGSNGKTTTKELLSTVLSSHFDCHFTQGNFNNHIGVPLTLLQLTSDTQVAVIEMGASHIGEIDFLCKIAEPTHGIITNIGKAHLEGFGSLEGVMQAKSELYQYLKKQNGVVFVNMDEPYLTELSEEGFRRVFYKHNNQPNPLDAPLETIRYENQPYLKVGFLDSNRMTTVIQSQLIGDYNFNNIMTAISIGRYFRVPSQKIKEAIESYIPTNNRSQIVKKDSNTFILDAYNANPASMSNALDNFGKINAKKKIAILGDMLELGKYSYDEHKQIVAQAKALNLEQVILVGKEFLAIKDTQVLHFENVQLLKEWFDEKDFQDSYFLIKGSRGIKLEQLLVGA